MQRHGGFRSKTRHKLSKNHRTRGKISVSRFFQEFRQGDKVILKAEPAYHKGMYYPRFHGKVGIVNGKQGDCYVVCVKDGKKEKKLIIHPVHLKSVKK